VALEVDSEQTNFLDDREAGQWKHPLYDCACNYMPARFIWPTTMHRAKLLSFRKAMAVELVSLLLFMGSIVLIGLGAARNELGIAVQIILIVLGVMLLLSIRAPYAYARYRLRALYRIDGHIVRDYFVWCCLPTCARLQEARHVDWECGILFAMEI
jgi:hypothetical protein